MTRESLAVAVIEVLKASSEPLDAQNIVARLRNHAVTKTDVNSVLYRELSSAGLVERNSSFRWRYVDGQPRQLDNSLVGKHAKSIRQEVVIGMPGSNGHAAIAEAGNGRNPEIDQPGVPRQLLSTDDWASIEAAVREEITAQSESLKSAWLDIDAIEQLPDAPGKFLYRLVLSTPVNFGAEQAVTFHCRNPPDNIHAVIVRCDDEGLIVECEKPLPHDAKLLSLSFDPTFILRALEDFIVQLASNGGQIARLVASKTLPAPAKVQTTQRTGLNDDQSAAIDEMVATPLHLLWGPPGTGKTTTLGAAVAEWMRQKKTVLVVSTSNAAVDVAMKAVLKRVAPNERRFLVRLGTSLDPLVGQITLGGKLTERNVALAVATQRAQRKLQEVREQLAARNLSHEKLHSLFAQANELEKQISDFNEQVSAASPQMMADVRVVGCTLAKMVLAQDFRLRQFDVVIVDEASMASMLYAFAASLLAGSHLVYAGDPKQLPPIVQAEGRNAAKWFGKNIYDWFDVEMGDEIAATKLSLLRTQYRMTNQIGGVVSRLTYGGLLHHGRNSEGPLVNFIDIDNEWQTTHYSVSEKSYYHLAAIPLLHSLSRLIFQDELLFLSPFRPQRSLLAALAFDIKARNESERRIVASTIHRSQGSEATAVIVDLTTHSPEQLVAFFRDKHCAKLFNVAISRAKDQLIVLGSRSMLKELTKTMLFWKKVFIEFDSGIDVMSCNELIPDLATYDDLSSVPFAGTTSLPAIYSHPRQNGQASGGVEVLRGLTASRKLLVLPDPVTQIEDGDVIVRKSTNCPPVFVGGGRVCLPWKDRWVAVESPNVSRVLWRIGFSHLADDEVDPIQVKRFFCPECANGDLVLQQLRGEGWFLVCNNGQVHECYYRRRLSLEDAKLKVRIHGMRCPQGHPLTARSGPHSIFLGCENYPECDFSESLSILSGV